MLADARADALASAPLPVRMHVCEGENDAARPAAAADNDGGGREWRAGTPPDAESHSSSRSPAAAAPRRRCRWADIDCGLPLLELAFVEEFPASRAPPAGRKKLTPPGVLKRAKASSSSAEERERAEVQSGPPLQSRGNMFLRKAGSTASGACQQRRPRTKLYYAFGADSIGGGNGGRGRGAQRVRVRR